MLRPVEMCIRDRYLGGPLTFLPQLKKSFDKTLGVTGICPENSLYFVALGAALYSDKELDLAGVVEKLHAYSCLLYTSPACR